MKKFTHEFSEIMATLLAGDLAANRFRYLYNDGHIMIEKLADDVCLIIDRAEEQRLIEEDTIKEDVVPNAIWMMDEHAWDVIGR